MASTQPPTDNDDDNGIYDDEAAPAQAAGSEEKERRRLSSLEKAALHGGIYAGGKLIEKKSSLSRGEVKVLEDAAHRAVDTDFAQARQLAEDVRDPNWYKKKAKKAVAKTLFGRQKKLLIGTLMTTVLVALAVGLFAFLGPLKNTHFDTVIRTANFLRFQHVIKKQFSRATFEAAVLSRESVGSFQRSSLLVKQLQLAVPDRQLKQLGRSGQVKWEFRDNRSFGHQVIPLRETFKAITVGDQRFDIDEFAREAFGADYQDLSRRQKWTVESRFVTAVSPALGEKMALLPRHVRWNPMFQLRMKVGAKLSRWANKAKEYAGMDEDEARRLHIQETVERVSSPSASRVRPGSSELAQGAEDFEQETQAAREEGRAPPRAGEIANSLKTRVKLLSKGADVATWTTVACIVYEIAAYFASAEGQRASQAARFAFTSAASAVQPEAPDGVDQAEAIGAANSDWDGVAGGPEDASKSQVYKELTGQPVNTNSAAYKNELNEVPLISPNNMFESFTKAIADAGGASGVSDFCGFMLAAGTQWVLTGAELLLSAISLGSIKGVTAGVRVVGEIGFHAAVGYGVSELLDWLIGLAIRSYANTDFLYEQGAARVGAMHVAYMSVAQNSNRTATMGAPMNADQAAAATVVAMEEYRAETNQSSFQNRYLAIDNPYSLLGRVVAVMPSNLTGLSGQAQSVASFIGSILTSPFKLIGSISGALSARTHAADTTFLKEQFGVDQWGWTNEELRRIDSDSSFSLSALLQNVEPRIAMLDARYNKCYDPTSFAIQSDRPDECTQEFLTSDDALYWRYYKSLFFAAQHMSGSV